LDAFHSLMLGFQVALLPHNLFFCLLGCFLGTLIGVLPGIGPAAGVTILIPITYGLSPVTALITMSGIYYGATYGGSTTSILLNIPGEASSVVTCLDGYQMARKGRGGSALGMAAFGSFIAGTFAIILLTFIATPLVNAALHFGPPEHFALTFMGLTMVTSLAGDSLLKGIISGLFGILIACVGVDVISGANRFTYGQIYLLDGFGFVNIAVGLFALSEVMINIEKPTSEVFVKFSYKLRDLLPNLQDWKDSIGAIWRGSVIGFVIGALPGTGAVVASFIAYTVEKKCSKHPEKFGTGVIEGVAAPESANNSAAQAAFLPMLTLGIPGSAVTAILLGALVVHGVRPGPMLMQTNPDLVWGLIASMYIGNIMLVILNLPLISVWVSFLRIPYKIIMPLIVAICSVGIYATETTIFDLWVMFFFGIIGYIFRKLQYPLSPVVLAAVLTPLVENSLKQSMIISQGSFSIFFTRPISAPLMIIGLFFLFAPFYKGLWQKLINIGKSDI
jgi:putative tricarboxylic transport membrane protein